MPTVVSTAGAADANSFASAAEFSTYCDGRLNSSAYTSASADDQARALIEATRELNVLAWQGDTVTDTQALTWPREWVTNPDDPNLDYFDNDVVPQRVKDATCELALQFLKAGTTDVAALDALYGVEGKSIDVISTQYTPHSRPTGIARYPRVLALVRPLLSSAGGVIRTVRG